MLMNAFQNRTSVLGKMLNNVFQTLTSELHFTFPEYDRVIFSDGDSSVDVFVNFHSIIISMTSCLDLLSKVAYELQEMPTVQFETYPKMNSMKFTFGSIHKLKSNLKRDNTIFSESKPLCISTLESIRDEIIHNGLLDFYNNLYSDVKDGVIEHWIFAPDFNEFGRLVTYKNRKKFYSNYDSTMNALLPQLMLDMIYLFAETLSVIIKEFDCEAYTDMDTINKYSKYLIALEKTMNWIG